VLPEKKLDERNSNAHIQRYFGQLKLIMAIDWFLKIIIGDGDGQQRYRERQAIPGQQSKNDKKWQGEQGIERKNPASSQVAIPYHIIAPQRENHSSFHEAILPEG
jgi:hypothetical protein